MNPIYANKNHDITGQWVRAAVRASGLKKIVRHKCSRCKKEAYYTVGEGLSYTDCKCRNYAQSTIAWYVVAALITMQGSTKYQAPIAKLFGIDLFDADWKTKILNTLASKLEVSPTEVLRKLNAEVTNEKIT